MNPSNATPGLVLVSLGLMLLMPGCQKSSGDAAWWQGEQQRLELSNQLVLKEYRYNQTSGGDVAGLEKLRTSNDTVGLRIAELTQKQSSLSMEVDSMQRRLIALREESIQNQRQFALGKKFKEFSVSSGRTYADASVAMIDDAGVTIRHADGSARLTYADLDDSQRQFFGLEESSSLAAEERERRQALAYEQWIDSSIAVVRQKEERLTRSAKLEEDAAVRARTMLAASQASYASTTRALAQPAKSFGGYSRNYYGYSRPTYRYVYHYNSNNYGYYGGSNYRSCYQPYQRISESSAVNPTTNRFKNFSTTTIPYIP